MIAEKVRAREGWMQHPSHPRGAQGAPRGFKMDLKIMTPKASANCATCIDCIFVWLQEGQGKGVGAASQSPKGRSGGPSFKADPKVISRLHKLEKHMRENKLRHTFADQLGEAQESDELNSKKEARKLAFYLFWNVRSNFDRYVLALQQSGRTMLLLLYAVELELF